MVGRYVSTKFGVDQMDSFCEKSVLRINWRQLGLTLAVRGIMHDNGIHKSWIVTNIYLPAPIMKDTASKAKILMMTFTEVSEKMHWFHMLSIYE